MGCVGTVLQIVSLILGVAGTAMGIYSVYKIYKESGLTPWCDICMEEAENPDEDCAVICSIDFESSISSFVNDKLQELQQLQKFNSTVEELD